jgi:adenylate cyclase
VQARRRAFRVWLLVGVGLASAAIVAAAYLAGLARTIEASSVDLRFELRGGRGAPSQVAVVGIDDKTLGALRVRWPFPRSYHARVIDRLHAAGAKVIAFDVQFTEPTVVREDNALATAIANAPPVTLATTVVDVSGRTNVLGGDANVRALGARVGNALLPPDAGGVVRRLAYSVDKLESFALVAAEQATGKRIAPSALGGRQAWIDFAGPAGTVRTYSYSDVLRGRFPPSAFKGRVVVVGATEPLLQDIHGVPIGGVMPGPEIQADAIATALSGFPLQPVSRALGTLLVFALALTMPLLSLRLRPLVALAATLGVAALYALAVQIAFEHGTILPFVLPLVALALAAVGSLAVHYLLEAFERARVHDAFSRFVPETVVDQVLARADGMRLGGERVDVTVMFSDIRGFTTFSEATEAERVIEILNRYLSDMSEAILDHGGTLVSYLGDGIMAVFGAPLPQQDHADRALAAALDMLVVRLPRVNEWIAGQGYGDGFKMGIGLNTGPVMVGNVGSERRLEYTAIGDTCNTASRIEGLTKNSGYALFLADSTRAALGSARSDFVDVGELEIRGRREAARLWSVAAAAV